MSFAVFAFIIFVVFDVYKRPSYNADGSLDIIDETLQYFKSNVFFKQYEIKSSADRVLIYITLYITECLKRLQRISSKNNALKEMQTLAIENFDLPGDARFPLNALYQKPARSDQDTLRQYLTQIRQETGLRLVEKVIDPATDKPSKWWLCFIKRRFMDKSLSGPSK
ncbi:actin-related protein 2/3 complex subunit 3-like isoform X2 [Antedon mediterranea]|uniref:actin-related protein 2/3 complex subunit 3-like isoform X2 n=1 Tax=Antedon mediterranea TaxID=105859 RepID=UPI003AF9F531